MKIFKFFVLALLSLPVLAGCDDKADEIPFVAEFALDDAKVAGGSLVIEDKAYVNYVILAANTNDWEMDYSPKGDWLAVTKFAEGESNRIKIEAQENATFGERTASVTFKYGGKQIGSLEVRQLSSAIILEVEEGSQTVNLSAMGQNFEIALLANTEYTVSFEPEEMSEWIWELVPDVPYDAGGTRAVGSAKKTLTFHASENEELPGRSGEIVFTAGDVECRAAVNQLGNVPDILVDETPVELAYNDTQLEIDVTSNVAYSVAVEYTDGSGWLTPVPQGFGMVGGTVKYTVAGNTMAEPRSAKVVLTYADTESGTDIRKEVPVTQKGHLVMSVGETSPAVSGGSIPLGFPASTFTVKLASNTVSAPAAAAPAWITQQGDAVYASGFYTYTFSFGDNNEYAARTGSIGFAIYGGTTAVAVSQAVGALYEDQVKIVNVNGSLALGGAIRTDFHLIYNGLLNDNWDSTYTPNGETVILNFELAKSSDYISKIVYYNKGNGTGNAHSMTGFELFTSESAGGEYVSHGSYTVEPAVYQQPREIVLREPVPNTGFVRMVITVPSNGWMTCAEMMFFSTAIQNDEYAGVVSTTLPSGTPAAGNYVPAAGATYSITLNTNLDFPFEYSDGVVITEAPTPFALPERAERTWDVTIPANTTGVWKQHTVKLAGSTKTFATLSIPQAFDSSKVSVDANSAYPISNIVRIMDLDFSEIWESNWSVSGKGHVYAGGDDIIREELPVTITVTFPGGAPSVSGMTICPRGSNGDWTKFRVMAKTAEDPTGTVVCTYDSGRIQTVKYVGFSSIAENVTELFIEITGTSNGTTASIKELVVWQ